MVDGVWDLGHTMGSDASRPSPPGICISEAWGESIMGSHCPGSRNGYVDVFLSIRCVSLHSLMVSLNYSYSNFALSHRDD